MYNAVVLNAHDQPRLRSRRYRDCVASNISNIPVTNAWSDGEFISNEYQQTAPTTLPWLVEAQHQSQTTPTTLPWLVEAQRQSQNRSYRQSSYGDCYELQNKTYNPVTTPMAEDNCRNPNSVSAHEQNDGRHTVQLVTTPIGESYTPTSNVIQPTSPITNKLQRVNTQSSPFYHGCMCGHDFMYRPFDPERNDAKIEVAVKSPVVNIRLR